MGVGPLLLRLPYSGQQAGDDTDGFGLWRLALPGHVPTNLASTRTFCLSAPVTEVLPEGVRHRSRCCRHDDQTFPTCCASV